MARLRWTDAMVARLLQLRVAELRAQFEAARRHPQLLAVAWTTLRLRFRAWLAAAAAAPAPAAAPNVLQLKNKWFCLRKEFADLRAAQSSGRQAAAYPSYWPALAAALGDGAALSPVAAVSPSRRQRLADKPARTRWTGAMTAALLELRLGDMREQFQGADARQKEAWERLARRFETQQGKAMDTQQLKAKYAALRQEFVKAVHARRVFDRQKRVETTTGKRSEVRPPVAPKLWPMLESYFSGRVEVPDDEGADNQQESPNDELEVAADTQVAPNTVAFDDSQRHEAYTAIQDGSTLVTQDVSELPPVLRLKWSNEMAATLLNLRCAEMRVAFASERSPAQLKLLWESLRVQFCHAHGIAVDATQLKNKYNALRREYLDLTQHPEADRPPFWDALVDCFNITEGGNEQTLDHNTSSAALLGQIMPGRPTEVHQQRPTTGMTNQGNESATLNENNNNDRLGSLMKLLELQAKRQQELQELVRCQTAQLEKVITDTSTVNQAVLQLLQQITSEEVNVSNAPVLE